MVGLSDYKAGEVVVVAYSQGAETVGKEQVTEAEKVGAHVKLVGLSEIASSGVKDLNKVSFWWW